MFFYCAVMYVLLFSINPSLNVSCKNDFAYTETDSIPAIFKGDFKDDYEIRYTISDSLWFQHPAAKYHILKWNTKEQYIIARNDTGNPTEKGLYTRIDYLLLQNMGKWSWGFCLTVYDARSESDAESSIPADRQNPKKGCNGFPFSRMNQIENKK
jgi:hypothetical protein